MCRRRIAHARAVDEPLRRDVHARPGSVREAPGPMCNQCVANPTHGPAAHRCVVIDQANRDAIVTVATAVLDALVEIFAIGIVSAIFVLVAL